MRRLKAFGYFEPTTLSEAIAILAEKGTDALPLAGGTDIVVRMKRGEITPAFLVNLKRIESLGQIRSSDDGESIDIGSLVSLSELMRNSLVESAFLLLKESARVLGSPSIRNLATLGGNVGRASPASDMAPGLMVLDAKVNLQGAEGKRSASVEDVFIGPGRTSLGSGEIITSFSLKKTGNGCGASYLKLSRTRGMDCAIVGVAAFVEMGEGQLLKKARIAMASVGPVPLRARKAEEILASSPASPEKIQESAVAASEEASPLDDMRASASYRKKMTEVLTSRALRQAVQAAKDQRRGVSIDD